MLSFTEKKKEIEQYYNKTRKKYFEQLQLIMCGQCVCMNHPPPSPKKTAGLIYVLISTSVTNPVKLVSS